CWAENEALALMVPACNCVSKNPTMAIPLSFINRAPDASWSRSLIPLYRRTCPPCPRPAPSGTGFAHRIGHHDHGCACPGMPWGLCGQPAATPAHRTRRIRLEPHNQGRTSAHRQTFHCNLKWVLLAHILHIFTKISIVFKGDKRYLCYKKGMNYEQSWLRGT